MAMTVFAGQRILAAWLLMLLATACAPLIGPYTQKAYENATSLKPQTLALMEKAREPYGSHQAAIEVLVIELQQAHEYVKGIGSNSHSARQWEILIAPNGDLLGKFLRRWRERGTLDESITAEFKGLVSDAFDEIICLEANKKEATACMATTGA